MTKEQEVAEVYLQDQLVALGSKEVGCPPHSRFEAYPVRNLTS